MTKEIRHLYLDRLIHASNTVNIFGKTNIDHLTFTGFMDTEEELATHVERIEKRALDLDKKFTVIKNATN